MKIFSRIFRGDRVIWVVFFFLCLISVVEVFSAASTLSYKEGSFWMPMLKHTAFLAVGALVVFFVHNIPCRYFKIIPIFCIPACWILLVITLFWGHAENEASRWLPVFGFKFQPSELAKGVLVIAIALVLSKTQEEKRANPLTFYYILILAFVTCILIVLENFSTAALLFCVVLAMMFIGRVPMKQLGMLMGVLALCSSMLLAIGHYMPDEQSEKIHQVSMLHRLKTWDRRITSFMEKHERVPADSFDIDKNAQVAHANIAIASSKWVGRMPGNSVERDFLSQAFSDFIYAIIIEELGIWGAFIVAFLYIIILFRAGRIASRCERNFPAFLVMGLAILLVAQAVLNMLVAVGLFPVTGQPLPLISRGGTSTLINCAYIGMILSVSRYAPKNSLPDSELSETDREFRSSDGIE